MTRARWERAPRAVVVLLALLIAACSKPAKAPGGTAEDADNAGRKPNIASQTVVGHVLGSIGERTIGPFLARSGDAHAGMVGWITGAEGMTRRVIAIPISGVGEPKGSARSIATVGIDATMLVVRATGGKSPGFALAWTVLTDRGEALWSVVLNDDGVPRDKPVELARTADDIVWVDVIPTDAGAVTVWAEETRGGDANVLVAGLDVDGKVRGVPARVARNVTGWHALEIPGGVGLSTVSSGVNAPTKPEPAKPAGVLVTPSDARGGLLSFQRLDGEGRVVSPPAAVVTKPVVSGDVEVVRGPGRLVFAWTDRTTDDPSVAMATLGDDGTVEAPRKVVEARGGAALIGLASAAHGTAILYEAPFRRGAGDARHVYSSRIGPGLAIEGRPVPVEVMGRATPELVAIEGGFAILAQQRDCEPGSPRCLDAPVIPTLVRTDARLLPVQREPFAFGADPASMAWGMTCARDLCVALAASGSAPARVRAAEVRARANVQAPVAATATPTDGPRVSDIAAVVTGETVVDLAVTHIADAAIVATLGTKADPPGAKAKVALDDARNVPLTIATRTIDAAGVLSTASTVITGRALAVGGVAMASADKPEDGAAIAWVARDNGDPEVHVTKIDKRGKKTNEVQLTTAKGDASDVAIAWTGNGWIVAWVDGRDGNGEVYATRVGVDLSRNAGERITNAPGDASDLVALASGDLVWLAWADPRESPKDGMADVFVGAVNKKDAKPAIAEQRQLATAAHSRTPQLAAPAALPGTLSGVVVAWIEEAPLGVETPASSGYGAMWATVGPDGKTTQRPVKLPAGGEGAATSVALERHAKGLHAVVARSMADAIALDGMELSGDAPRAYPLVTLDGPPSLDVALVLDGAALYFNDDGPSLADKRARRARITWLPGSP